MKALAKRFLKDERGLELSEYAVMLALIIVFLFLAIEGLASAIQGKFVEVDNKIDGAAS